VPRHSLEAITVEAYRFVFDILIARSCRELGATLVSRNSADLSRIAKVFSFDFVAPYPIHGAD
jgi:hypothetical protein